MIALNFDALGGNNYSHLDTSSFCFYIDRRDNETPVKVAQGTDPITAAARFYLYKLLLVYVQLYLIYSLFFFQIRLLY